MGDPVTTTPLAARLDAALADHRDVATALDEVHAAVWRAVDPTLLELARLRIAMLLGCDSERVVRTEAATAAGLDEATIADLAVWPRSPRFDERRRACLEFVEQYLIDVAGMTTAQTDAVAAHLGPHGLTDFAAAVLVLEQRQRLALTWDRILRRGDDGP
jgi:alkylhydroperoxidase family enzyme